MRLKAVSENKDTAATPSLRIMNIAGLATAGNVPFVNRVVWSKKSNYADSAAACFGQVNWGRGCLLAAKGGSLGDWVRCRITRPGWCFEMIQ